jgi:hypothetical protein
MWPQQPQTLGRNTGGKHFGQILWGKHSVQNTVVFCIALSYAYIARHASAFVKAVATSQLETLWEPCADKHFGAKVLTKKAASIAANGLKLLSSRKSEQGLHTNTCQKRYLQLLSNHLKEKATARVITIAF